MGAYINPKKISKEDWLLEHAEKTDGPTPWSEIEEGFLPVVLVDNSTFKAAAIGFNKEEYGVFLENDGRPKEYWIAKIEDLHTVSSELKDYLSPKHRQMRK